MNTYKNLILFHLVANNDTIMIAGNICILETFANHKNNKYYQYRLNKLHFFYKPI